MCAFRDLGSVHVRENIKDCYKTVICLESEAKKLHHSLYLLVAFCDVWAVGIILLWLKLVPVYAPAVQILAHAVIVHIAIDSSERKAVNQSEIKISIFFSNSHKH